MAFVIGVDTGGTFTDCVAVDEKGMVTIGKAPSTPQDFSLGVIESVRAAAGSLDRSLEEMLGETSLLVHSSTVATNAMITRSGVKAGLITTAGFEDTILIMRVKGRVAGIGEAKMLRMVRTDKPVPIIPRPRIKGVRERIDSKGRVVMPLQQEDVVKAADDLVKSGVKSIAVALLWSFVNPMHEREIKRIITELYPDLDLTLSSELVPLLGEYERTSTTAINAYLGPVVRGYLNSLAKQLRDEGLDRPPLIMQAYGGSLPIEEAEKQVVSTISSGPAAGVVASEYLAELLGYRNVITTDVGGTTFDVGLILGGTVQLAREPIFCQYHISTPMIEVESIGAGGGSIARVEPVMGLLQVGPQSAGAQPGPVCYDIGGAEPTVTDADLVLGYLNPHYFLGGKMLLNKEKAEDALRTKIAKPLGMDPIEAAASIYDIINAQMADLVRKVTIERGYDPRECVLFAYGGAGPVHAGAFISELGIKEVIVPFAASVHCAMGAALSDVMHTYMLTDSIKLPCNADRLNKNFATLEVKAREVLQREGFGEGDMLIRRYVGMKYWRQTHELNIPVPPVELTGEHVDRIVSDFEGTYEKLYGQGAGHRKAGIEMMTFKVEAVGKIVNLGLKEYPLGPADPAGALKARRNVFFRKFGTFRETCIFDMAKLAAGNVVEGPAIVESPVTTIVIQPGQRGKIDKYTNVVIEAVAGS